MTHYTRVPLRNGRRRPRHTLPAWLIGALAGVFVLATLISAVFVFATVRNFVASWTLTNESFATPAGGQQAGGQQPGAVDPLVTPEPGSTPVPTVAANRWAGSDRVTILVMGIDRREGEEERGYLTDTMLLVTIDPVARTAAMLSIPRDLWVEIPGGYGMNTINTANRSGDWYNYPGGGPALAVKTVQYNLGVTVNYYIRLDFTAFVNLIDAIGGIDIYNEEDIDDPQYPDGSYGFDPFYLPAGQHHLDGYNALRYARTRHGATDIDRAHRQQQVIMAAREKIFSLNMLPTLVLRAPYLYQTLNDNIKTDMSLEQIVSLGMLAQDIPRENIRTAVIDYQYVLDYYTPEGRQVLVPLRDKIRVLRDELFGPTVAASPSNSQDTASLIEAEAARVMVLNGAGVENLACDTRRWLERQGLQEVGCATAERSDYSSTVIIDYTGKPYTVGWLKDVFGVSTIISGADPSAEYDIRVILGRDWAVPAGGGQ
jgi:polyisoprenyl-teichoic acid--peptidoglycan teichoic acid transferase